MRARVNIVVGMFEIFWDVGTTSAWECNQTDPVKFQLPRTNSAVTQVYIWETAELCGWWQFSHCADIVHTHTHTPLVSLPMFEANKEWRCVG